MSSKHQDHGGTEHASDEPLQKVGSDRLSVEELAEEGRDLSEPGKGPVPIWLAGLIGFGIFWAGAYLFSFSGGFKADVFDFEPKYGAEGGGAKGAPDPKVVGKA